MTIEWRTGVLQEAIDQNGKRKIFNTDQGSQYRSKFYNKLLIDNDIKILLYGKGRATDNISSIIKLSNTKGNGYKIKVASKIITFFSL
jgi:hypothetical protein